MCICFQSTVDKSAFASTYQYASLGSPFENQTSLSHSRSVTFKLDETPAWLPMDNHAGISVSFLNRCFNVTLPWHVCKRMISQRFITCHSQHMLGCWTTFYKNSCVGLSLKRVSFFQRDRSFTTFFSFYQHHHIELLDRILISISSYAFCIKSIFTQVVKAKVMAKNKVLNPLIQIVLP